MKVATIGGKGDAGSRDFKRAKGPANGQPLLDDFQFTSHGLAAFLESFDPVVRPWTSTMFSYSVIVVFRVEPLEVFGDVFKRQARSDSKHDPIGVFIVTDATRGAGLRFNAFAAATRS